MRAYHFATFAADSVVLVLCMERRRRGAEDSLQVPRAPPEEHGGHVAVSFLSIDSHHRRERAFARPLSQQRYHLNQILVDALEEVGAHFPVANSINSPSSPHLTVPVLKH